MDRVAFFVAPMLLGGRAAPTPIGGPGRPLPERVRLQRLRAARPWGGAFSVPATSARAGVP